MPDETPRPLTSSEMDAFEAIAASVGPMTCCCQYGDHKTYTSDGVLPYCGKPAVVQVEIHLAHVCRHPQFVDGGRVNAWGNTVQLLCAGCLEELRQVADQKIAATRARCTTLSTSCPACGNGLAVRGAGDKVYLCAHCPACGTPRQQVDPVCGGGVVDASGQTHGCGKRLDSFSDIIVGVKWLDGQ